MVARMQHEHQWHPDTGDLGQPPAIVQPDAFVLSSAGLAVGWVLAVPRRLRERRAVGTGRPQAVHSKGLMSQPVIRDSGNRRSSSAAATAWA